MTLNKFLAILLILIGTTIIATSKNKAIMNSYYYAIYFGAFLTVAAQLLLKKAALKCEKTIKLRSVLNPLSLLAYLMFVLVTLFTFYGLKK